MPLIKDLLEQLLRGKLKDTSYPNVNAKEQINSSQPQQGQINKYIKIFCSQINIFILLLLVLLPSDQVKSSSMSSVESPTKNPIIFNWWTNKMHVFYLVVHIYITFHRLWRKFLRVRHYLSHPHRMNFCRRNVVNHIYFHWFSFLLHLVFFNVVKK